MQLFTLILTPRTFLFMSVSALHRVFFRCTNRLSPSSEPYLSGDTFRAMCHHVLDTRSNIDPSTVCFGDIVFVSLTHIPFFFKEIHPNIQEKYTLLTHNGDITITSPHLRYLDAKIIYWFSQNVDVKHKRILPLPIGLENLSYYNHGIPKLFSNFTHTTSRQKKPKILYGFSTSTNPKIREKARKALSQLRTSDEITSRLISPDYMKVLESYMFVASPPGNGLDCHRTWEALYVKTIPIVLRSVSMEYFAQQGVPIYIIDKWSDLNNLSESNLRDIYMKRVKLFESPALWFGFWKNKIKK